MRALHIIQIFHPSGMLFEAFEAFVRLHPQASRLQSGAFYQQLQNTPDVEPVLLLAVNVQKLQDPGRWEGVKDGKWKTKNEKSVIKKEEGKGEGIEDRREEADGGLIAGSLLGVIVRTTVPRWMRFWPLRSLYVRFCSRTIVYGGPLLAPGSRLEQETTLGLLVEELQRKTSGRSRYTQYRNLFDCSEYLPKFRSLGFQFSEGSTPVPDHAAMESLQLKDLLEKGTGKAISGMKLVTHGSFMK